MLEIDCSELPRELCHDIFDDTKEQLSDEMKNINILPQSQLIIVNQDNEYLYGQLKQVVKSSLRKTLLNSSDYTREDCSYFINNGIVIRRT